jgi:hypothetical protein
LQRGEDQKSCSLPFARGGLGWGNSFDFTDKLRYEYTIALCKGGGRGGNTSQTHF